MRFEGFPYILCHRLQVERWYAVPKGGEERFEERDLRFEVVRGIQAVKRQRGAVRLPTSEWPFGPAVGGLYNHIRPPLLIKPYNRACGAKGKRKTAAIGSFPPLVPYGTTFPPLKRWDYGCCAMCHMSLQVSTGKSSPPGAQRTHFALCELDL